MSLLIRKAPLTGIEMSDTYCRITQLVRASSGYVVTENFVVDFPETPAATVDPDAPDANDKEADIAERVRAKADLLRAALRERNIKISAAGLCLSKGKVTARYRQLPPADNDEELAQMAHIEAERHIPFNAERHQVDYHVMARDDIAGSDVLIVAVDSPVVDEALAICQQAGVDVARADASSSSLYRLARKRVVPVSGAGDEDEGTATAIVHIGPRDTDVALLSNGLLVFARNTNFSPHGLFESLGDDAPDDIDEIDALQSEGVGQAVERWLGRLVKEVDRTHLFASREFNCAPIGEVLVSGEGLRIQNIGEYLRINLEAPVRPLFDRASDDIQNAIKSDASDSSLDAAALAIGVAIDGAEAGEKTINLLPGHHMRRRQRKRQIGSLSITAALAVGAITLAGFLFAREQSGLRARLAEHEDYVAENRGRVVDISRREKEIHSFAVARDSRKNPTYMLDFVAAQSIVRKNARLLEFKFIRDRELRMRGHALQLQDATALVTELKASGYFYEVKAVYGKYALPRRQEVYEFEITCSLKKPEVKKKKSADTTESEE